MPSPSLNRRFDWDRRFQQPFRYTGLDDYWWRYDPIHIVSPVPFLQMRDGRPSISGSTPAFGLPSTSTGNAQYNQNARLFGSEGTMLWSGSMTANLFVQPACQVGVDFGTNDYISIQSHNSYNGALEFYVRTNGTNRFFFADTTLVTAGGNAILSGGPSGTFCCVNGSLRSSSSNTTWANGFSTTSNRVVAVNYQNRGSTQTSLYPWAIVAFFAKQIPQHDALELSRNPYLLFRPEASANQIFYSLGTLTSSTSIALTSNSITSFVGNLTANTAVQLNSNSLTSYVGTLTPATNISLVGQSATFNQGVLSVTGSINVNLTGLTFTGTTGSLRADLALSILGQSATFTRGNLQAEVGLFANLTGLSISSTLGSLVPHLQIPLTGQVVTGNQGTIIPSVGFAVNLTGLSFVGVTGNLTTENAINLIGQNSSFIIGNIAPSSDAKIPKIITLQFDSKQIRLTFNPRFIQFRFD